MFTFSKNERLKSKKAIGLLFTGNAGAYLAYPIRIVWTPLPYPTSEDAPVQVMISVPKRQFKTATARNRIKRMVREAWRLQKHEFYARIPENTAPIAMMLMYIAKEELPFTEIQSGIKKAIRKHPLLATS